MKLETITQRRVEAFDRRLIFQEKYLDHEKNLVYRVSLAGREYILKAHPIIDGKTEYLNREIEALKRLGHEKEFPELFEVYREGDGRSGLLKQFMPGREASRKKWNSNWSKRLSLLIQKAHYYGVSDLDIESRNLILCPKRKTLSLPDLDYAVFEGDVEPKDFEILKAEDFTKAKDLFGERKNVA